MYRSFLLCKIYSHPRVITCHVMCSYLQCKELSTKLIDKLFSNSRIIFLVCRVLNFVFQQVLLNFNNNGNIIFTMLQACHTNLVLLVENFVKKCIRFYVVMHVAIDRYKIA